MFVAEDGGVCGAATVAPKRAKLPIAGKIKWRRWRDIRISELLEKLYTTASAGRHTNEGTKRSEWRQAGLAGSSFVHLNT